MKRQRSSGFLKLEMRTIDKIIIHCTATVEGQQVSVADVDRWHRERGFNGIGYHYLIGLNGKVWRGRDEEIVGAHCVNHNQRSIGVCYVGGVDKNMKPKDTRTEAQKEALLKLLRELVNKYHLTSRDIHGHREFANKACPCFDVAEYYA